jgi:hypothetical protein
LTGTSLLAMPSYVELEPLKIDNLTKPADLS